MTDKLEKSKQIAEREMMHTVKQSAAAEDIVKSAMMLGAVKTVNHMNAYFSSQTIRGLQRIRDEKHFEQFGFSRFDDFLDESPHSPMSYKQFYDREKALINEGDEMFDVLNSLNFSLRKRRLLGAGNVVLEDNKMLIKRISEDGGEYTEEVSISDQQKLIQTLSALADQTARLQNENEKQKTRLNRRDRDIEQLTEQIQKGTGGGNSALFERFAVAKNALAQLADTVEKHATDTDKKRNGELYLNELYAEFARVRQNFGRNDLRFDAPADTDGEFADITAKMNEDELADLME